MPKINVKGDIVDDDTAWIYDYFEIDCVSPKKITQALRDADGEDVTLEIASNGGSVVAASEIYTALRNYRGKLVGEVVGMAASAASVIACACGTLRMSPTALIMIHNAWMTSSGDKNAKNHDVELLSSVDESIINAYEHKTGQTREQLSDWMTKETWLNAQDAVKNGFADEVMFEDSAVIAASSSSIIPKSAVNKFKNIMLQIGSKPEKEDPKEPQQSLLQRKIKLLKGE